MHFEANSVTFNEKHPINKGYLSIQFFRQQLSAYKLEKKNIQPPAKKIFVGF